MLDHELVVTGQKAFQAPLEERSGRSRRPKKTAYFKAISSMRAFEDAGLSASEHSENRRAVSSFGRLR
jgi:hypothetical protein